MDTNNPVNSATILIVDDTPSNLSVLFDYLSGSGYKVLVAEDGETALEQVQQVRPDLIMLDVMMPGIDGYQTCERLKQSETSRDIPVIFLTSLADIQDKIKGFQVGGVDYITKPLQHEEVLARVHTHLSLRRLQQSLERQNQLLQREIDAHQRSKATVRYLNRELTSKESDDLIIGESPPMKELLEKLARVAKTDSTVFFHGETGTGKELFARELHNQSQRREQPFVKIDCTAVPKEHADREFFGVEQSTADGVNIINRGRFELADGGTVFLDEIAELPISFQAKLLRFIENQEFERTGGSLTYHVDVRIIVATNQNLDQAVAEGRFREDLFYRLNVFPLSVPPLRERKADIRQLVDYFFDKNVVKLGNRVKTISASTLEKLENHSWPGNVRELENCIERALILSSGPELDIKVISFSDATEAKGKAQENPSAHAEHDHILKALQESNWIIEGADGAARALGIDPVSLRVRMRKIGIPLPVHSLPADTPDFRLSEQEFATAIKLALQYFIEIDHFQKNPLLGSAMVAARVGAEANQSQRIDSLKNLLEETGAGFAKHPKTELFARVLHRTYFQPARSQELAADALGLGYSTYRRHLAKARSLLTAELWQEEQRNK